MLMCRTTVSELNGTLNSRRTSSKQTYGQSPNFQIIEDINMYFLIGSEYNLEEGGRKKDMLKTISPLSEIKYQIPNFVL